MAGGGQGAKGPQTGTPPNIQQTMPNINWGGGAGQAMQGPMTPPNVSQVMPNVNWGGGQGSQTPSVWGFGQGMPGPMTTPTISQPAPTMPPEYGTPAQPMTPPAISQPASPTPQQMQEVAQSYAQMQRPAPFNPGLQGATLPQQFMQDARFQQNPMMRQRISDMMPSINRYRQQVQGNPSAMPVQRLMGRRRPNSAPQ